MPGPCDCGDIACPSCGDPYAAMLEEATEKFFDLLDTMKMDQYDYQFLIDVTPALIKSFREAKQSHIDVINHENAQHVDYLQSRLGLVD